MTNQAEKMNVLIPAHIVPEYCNVLNVSFNKEEFSLNFIKTSPPQSVMAARVITSPGHVKRISQFLTQMIKEYEDQFGSIDTADQSQTIGFQERSSNDN